MNNITRRQFLARSSALTAGFWIAKSSWARVSPNEKINIGVIGVANRGGENLRGVSGEDVVALCDVDENYLNAARAHHPDARRYTDFRRMLEQKGIDAVVISTADHTHAVAAVAAMRQGCHVYCEKPLTRTVSEARIVTETARKCGRVTQMGTQIHASDNYRRVVELIQGGIIGPVREVHVWVNTVWAATELPQDTPEIPKNLNWDLWLGPAHYRPYHPAYVPRSWRNWWDFGGGGLGDMGCHYIDLVFWALGLRHPTLIEADGPPVHTASTPPWLTVRYEFPARRIQHGVNMTWYHGVKGGQPVRPAFLAERNVPAWDSAVLFIGNNGMLLADYGRCLLLPEDKFSGFKAPAPSIPPSIGHHAEWIQAIKLGKSTLCEFDYAGALTETVLLGNVAYRSGGRIEWDAARLRAKGNSLAQYLIQHHYRRGWAI